MRWHSIIISETRKKRWTEKSPIVKSLQKIVKINDRPLKPLAAVFFHFLTLGFNPESHIVSLLRCPVDTLMTSITTYLSIFLLSPLQPPPQDWPCQRGWRILNSLVFKSLQSLQLIWPLQIWPQMKKHQLSFLHFFFSLFSFTPDGKGDAATEALVWHGKMVNRSNWSWIPRATNLDGRRQ